MTWRPVPQTAAESETTFRWDDEARVLHCGTTSHRVANRWAKAGLPVVVLSKGRDGEPRSWSLDVPTTGREGEWIRVFRLAVPQYRVANPTKPPE